MVTVKIILQPNALWASDYDAPLDDTPLSPYYPALLVGEGEEKKAVAYIIADNDDPRKLTWVVDVDGKTLLGDDIDEIILTSNLTD